MKIIFDISVLGRGYASSYFRTGVYRYTTDLLLSLLKSGETEIFFYSSQGNHFECTEYLKQNQIYNIEKLLFKKPWDIKTSCLKMIYKIFRFKFPHIFQMLILIAREVILSISKILSVCKTSAIQKRISEMQCYYSPLYEIPNFLIKNQHIKKILTIHDLIPLIFPEYCSLYTRLFMKKIMANLKKDITVFSDSASTKNDILHFSSINSDQVKVIYPGCSPLFFQQKNLEKMGTVLSKLYLPKNLKYFLSVFTLEPRKNVPFLIQCFVQFIKESKINDLYFVMVGAKGWQIKKILEELSLKENETVKNKIIFPGFISDEDLNLFYNHALAFCFPSIYEGFGLPVLESMKCGLPVLSSNSSSLPEIVQDSGFLLDPKNQSEWISAMDRIYHDDSMRKDLSAKAAQRSRALNWDQTIADFLKEMRG